MYGGDADAKATALAALEQLLKLLHPAMPHVTEEIWTSLPGRSSRLIVAPWPEPGADGEAGALDAVQAAAATFRRSGVRVPLEGDAERIFAAVVRPERFTTNGNVEVERERLRSEIDRLEVKLANAQFVAKAPPDVVQAEREKLEKYRAELDALGD
jgi:valyl-tRNA synthetase